MAHISAGVLKFPEFYMLCILWNFFVRTLLVWHQFVALNLTVQLGRNRKGILLWNICASIGLSMFKVSALPSRKHFPRHLTSPTFLSSSHHFVQYFLLFITQFCFHLLLPYLFLLLLACIQLWTLWLILLISTGAAYLFFLCPVYIWGQENVSNTLWWCEGFPLWYRSCANVEF